MKPNKGFTLIEMLIVVAIIGILAGVVLVGLGPVQRGGRDARRIADLRQVQNALELYFNKCGYYPGTAAPTTCPGFSQITTWDNLRTALTGSNIGVNQIPNDPTAGRNYLYATNSTGSSYVLGAQLEDSGNPALRNDIDSFVYGINCGDPANDTVYCIQF
jgi:prepilin-type N-terminal cleavage/methylation domain-containing protein